MKTVFAVLMLVSGSAFASEVNYSRPQDELYIDFISWCDSNNVMGQDSQGQTYVKFNCSEYGQTCRQTVTHRHNRTLYFAACSDK
ncbi:hypothetical protein AB1A81_02255 [Bdellovibrio bacteriovorus]|uniref:Uncharacterized protein n=1 Tax=Bdellovibrio bacteriovorus (strain ATCC 15356 / DSM 50701 / NCIMB 9529 / HD100) TaxID=264462 RepID=Q6MQH9_BDEBA|nr:hypothetical protein [Bdellovibrio bacteriovorus]AHZ86101.1 hypothetical protein EP01_14335 [Bdellovibrio bacteriovorus]BEV67026.1 hypothetical protein Bb109J_c0446 [Bdellovibrio bacteriovorus]CAE78468.1 hypothetical protein predicted by Glimmer/Critica [Bdellovibrio bacteriovorus HD100]